MTVAESPFHEPWPRAIVRPDEYDGGDALAVAWDLGRVAEADRKSLVKAWTSRLPTLRQVKRLDLWTHVTQPVFDAACELPQLEVLRIKWSNVAALDAIAQLGRLRALSIGSSTRVKSIEPLAALQSLKWLELENFKSILDFSPLAKLKALERLAVTGSMWSRQAIASLEPFGAMTWLSSLAVDTSSVESLRALGRLKTLRLLEVGGRLPFEEYARLSAQLPATECRWFAPYLELAGTDYAPCPSCRQDSMVMLTGKGKPVLCRHCDSAKVARHVDAFDAARDA